jgi:hypothetical protein
MKAKMFLVLAAGLFAVPPVFAEGTGTPFFFEFKGEGGVIPLKDSDGTGEGISLFSIVFDQPIEKIISLEVELRGLTHTEPADLDIFVYRFQDGYRNAQLMTDSGDSVGVDKVDLVFNDNAVGFPSEDGELLDGTYQPELGTLMELAAGSPDIWFLLIIDDSPGDTGSLNQWFIRGVGVPEPMSLSLLAVGAVAMIRRRFAA